jgi:rRNA processing protein Gar1
MVVEQELIFAEMGKFLHASEGELVCESVNPKVPYFNAPIYLENKVGDVTPGKKKAPFLTETRPR